MYREKEKEEKCTLKKGYGHACRRFCNDGTFFPNDPTIQVHHHQTSVVCARLPPRKKQRSVWSHFLVVDSGYDFGGTVANSDEDQSVRLVKETEEGATK